MPELSEAEKMGAETARFEKLLLQVRTDRLHGSWVFGGFVCVCVYARVHAHVYVHTRGCSGMGLHSQNALHGIVVA